MVRLLGGPALGDGGVLVWGWRSVELLLEWIGREEGLRTLVRHSCENAR